MSSSPSPRRRRRRRRAPDLRHRFIVRLAIRQILRRSLAYRTLALSQIGPCLGYNLLGVFLRGDGDKRDICDGVDGFPLDLGDLFALGDGNEEGVGSDGEEAYTVNTSKGLAHHPCMSCDVPIGVDR